MLDHFVLDESILLLLPISIRDLSISAGGSLKITNLNFLRGKLLESLSLQRSLVSSADLTELVAMAPSLTALDLSSCLNITDGSALGKLSNLSYPSLKCINVTASAQEYEEFKKPVSNAYIELIKKDGIERDEINDGVGNANLRGVVGARWHVGAATCKRAAFPLARTQRMHAALWWRDLYQSIERIGGLSELEWLCLAGVSGVNDSVLQALGNCRQLQTLDIKFCRKVTEVGLMIVLDFPVLFHLEVQGVRAYSKELLLHARRVPKTILSDCTDVPAFIVPPLPSAVLS
uniref:Distal membrane arm assembly complex 2-like protein n=1 Tax=Angiostrongylus cantonensis TaxID=6313 RepID=A0A0K0D1I2_ANGCA